MPTHIYEPQTGNPDDGYVQINITSQFLFNDASLTVGKTNNSFIAGIMLYPTGTGFAQGATIANAVLRCFVISRQGTPLLEAALDGQSNGGINPVPWSNSPNNHPYSPNFIPIRGAGAYSAAPSIPGANTSFDIDVTDDVQALADLPGWDDTKHTRAAIRPTAALANFNFCTLSSFEAGQGVHVRLIVTTLEEEGEPNIIVRDAQGNVLTSGATINMGTTPDGTADTEAISVQNTGNVVLNISSVGETGGADFDSPVDLPSSIAASDIAPMTVRRLAAVVGSQTRTITINSDDPDTPAFVINFSSTVLQRYIEVQSPTGAIINPPNPNTTRYSVGTIETGETASRQLKVFGRNGSILTSADAYIDDNIYNTLTSEWFTKSNSLLDQRGGNNLVQAETVVYTLETVGSNGTFYSATFDGTNDWCKVNDVNVSPDPCPSGTPFYWSCWFFTASIVNSVLMAKWHVSTTAKQECRVYLLTAGAALKFDYRGTNSTTYTATAAASPSTSAWQHVLCGVDGSGNIRIYLNGGNGATTPVAAPLNQGTAPFTIGSQDNGNSKFTGKILAPRVVVGVAPSATLATTLYNSGTPLDLDDPFSITENISSGATLNSIEDNLTIEFTPVAEQTYDATIIIPSNAIDSPNQTLIRGIGSAAAGTITVDDETPTDIPNGGTLDLDNPAVDVGEDEQLTITAVDDDIEIASIRMNDPSGGAQNYAQFPLMATRNRQAFVDAYAGAATGIFREVYSGASDEAYPAQNNGLRKTLWGHYEVWQWNQDKYSVMLPVAPPLRTQTGAYGDGGVDSSSELITGGWTFDGGSRYGNPSGFTDWADYVSDATTIFGFNIRPQIMTTSTWMVMQICSDGSQLDEGFETWINGYDGTRVGNGVDKFIDTSAGLDVYLMLPTFDSTGANATYGSIEWKVTWSASPERDATQYNFDTPATGRLDEGVDFDADRQSIGSDVYHIKVALGTFDFRAQTPQGSDTPKYMQVHIRKSSDGGVPKTPCGLTTMWVETANSSSQKGRVRIPLCRSGSDFLQMLSNYANGGSMLALFAPDLIEVGGFGNYCRRTPTKTAAQLVTDLQNYIDFLRGIVADVPIIVDGGWNIDDGTGDGEDPLFGEALPDDQQLLLDTFSSIAYSIDRDMVAVMNYRRYLESVGWVTSDVPADQEDHDGTTIDGTHPAWEGAMRICEGQYACHEALIMIQFTEEIADATTILEDATDTFTIENTAVIIGAYASQIGPTLTNIVITHDGLDSPHIIHVTGTVGATAIIQVENEIEIVPPYGTDPDYYTDTGTTQVGVPIQVTFTIENIGTIQLGIGPTYITDASNQLLFILDIPAGTVLQPGETATLIMRVRATSVADLLGSAWNIYHDGQDTLGITGQFRALLEGEVEESDEEPIARIITMYQGGVTRIEFRMTTDASGDAAKKIHISGFVHGASIVPGGAETPTLEVTDAVSIDLLQTDSASNSARRIDALGTAQPVDEEVMVIISGGGNAVDHDVYLYVSNTNVVKHGVIEDV